jgi:hypothetical protein
MIDIHLCIDPNSCMYDFHVILNADCKGRQVLSYNIETVILMSIEFEKITLLQRMPNAHCPRLNVQCSTMCHVIFAFSQLSSSSQIKFKSHQFRYENFDFIYYQDNN